jgi:hypothetical protein
VSPIVLTMGIKIMQKTKGVSLRRHHYNRLKSKRENLHYWGRGYNDSSSWCKASLGIAVNTPKNCSCYMCGNPRKHWKEVTRQELKANDIKDTQDY